MKVPSLSKLVVAGLAPVLVPVIALLSGCGQSPPPVAADSTPTSEPTQQKIVLYTWTDYVSPEAIQMFTDETGIEVEYKTCEASEELKAMLESAPGEYDVVIADEVTLAELIDLQLIQKLDQNSLANKSHLDQRYLNLAHDPGNQYSLPYAPGATIFAYRSDKFTPKEESWSVFWDENLRGRVTMLDEMEEVFAVGLLREGHSLNSQDPQELNQALESLAEAVKTNAIEFGGVWDNMERLVKGEIWAMQCYNGDAASMRDGLYPFSDGPAENIEYFIPQEGARLWVDSFAIARESNSKGLAHKFIDFLLRPEVAAENSHYLWYATPNKAALELLDPELLADEAVFPNAKVKDRCEFLTSTTGDHEQTMLKGMSQLLSLSRDARGNLHAATPEEATQEGGAE